MFLDKIKQMFESQLLIEMAKIGGYSSKNDQFEVWVYYTEPMKNPSFHFKNKTNDYEVVLTIKDLKELEWKKPRQGRKIPVQHLRTLVSWFSDPYDKNPKITNWEAMAVVWNSINEVQISNKMPDYQIIG